MISLKILKILNDRKIAVCLPILTSDIKLTIIPIIVPRTTKKSKAFQLSLKYLEPRATILRIASRVKMPENM